MSKVRLLQQRLREFAKEEKQNEVILNIIKEDAPFLIQIQRRQLFESTDSQGQPLGEYSSIAYANRKGRITVDLKLTGKFYDGIFVDADEFPVTFGSVDSKAAALVQKYGREIFGIRKDYLDLYIQTRFKTKYTDYFRSLFQL